MATKTGADSNGPADDVQDQDVDDTPEDDVTDDATDDDAGEGGDDADDAGDQDSDSGKKPTPKPKSTPPVDDPNAGLKKALQSEREQRRRLDRELKDLQKKHASAEERQLLEAKEQAAAEAEERVKGPLIKALAVAELRGAGVQGGSTTKLVRLLDLDKVELSDDGELSGLEDQIAELREEFPNLFAAATGGTRVPNVNGGSGSRTGRSKDKDDQQTPKGFAQILADQLTGAAPPGQGWAGR